MRCRRSVLSTIQSYSFFRDDWASRRIDQQPSMSRPQKKAKKMQQMQGIPKDEEKFKLFVDLDGVLYVKSSVVASLMNSISRLTGQTLTAE
mmetsp:Transcript_18680/g.42327  ORF Transcript_18680/g.42327 Transcript_18680/m.42327 type:complete len:91 (-) Transcript_18680:717-989(-)